MPATMDISEAREEFHRLDEKLKETRVVYVKRHNNTAFAIIDPEYLQALLETLDILAEPGAIEMLEQSIRDVREGRVVPHEDVEAELG